MKTAPLISHKKYILTHSESYTDILGRFVEVNVYQYIDEYGKVKTIERRSFQDKNLLNSVTLHKEMNNVKI